MSSFAFSTFVTSGLARLPAPDGHRAVQSINVTAVTPAFMSLLFGTAALCLVSAGWALRRGDLIVVLAAVVQVLGSVAVTVVVHVPLNNGLAAVDASAPEAGAVWAHYLDAWVRWNHLRALAGALASGLLVLALLQR